MKYVESTLEEATLEWFKELGYQIIYGSDVDPFSGSPERKSLKDVVLESRLKDAIDKVNPRIPEEAKEEAFKKVLRVTHGAGLIQNNKKFHKLFRDGVDVEYRRNDGTMAGNKVWLIDKTNVENNDFLAVNQFTVDENKNRRPDVVIFINGLPIALFELKNMVDENVGIYDAYNQVQTYKNDIPSLFAYNELTILSDGVDARMGSLNSPLDWFMRWRSIDEEDPVSEVTPRLEVLVRGVFDKSRILDILTNFIIFETDGEKTIKKIAAYHQYFATNNALAKTISASSEKGDRKGGVVWHTQGSGKSLTMVFYSGKLISSPELNNPTIVVITDRNDLDEQLFGTFSANKELLRQSPKQAKSRSSLKELLKIASGGVIFTTIQKFVGDEVLSNRKNIIVIADEAHRSQYDFIDGFARRMRDSLPKATFIGFTGTPLELSDKNTRSVFGEYTDIYDIQRSVEDEATVPIFYEARLAKIDLLESEKPHVDRDFEEVTEEAEEDTKSKLKSKWARLEAMVGSEKRIQLVAKDIVDHFEDRRAVIEGKGMIVAMSRRIAVDLYEEIIRLRPDWHNDDDDEGFIKVVMTGSASDPQNFQPHIRNKQGRRNLATRFKKFNNELKLVIVRDMWLTGFDVPSLHTMYIDKPMKGHGLMQTIARVNRTFKDKQGGLIVDYIGLASQLQEALNEYTETDRSKTVIPIEKAVSLMIEKYEVVEGILHGFDYSKYFTAKAGRKTQIIVEAMNFILGQKDGKKRYKNAVAELSKAFSLAVPHEKAVEIRDEVGLFQEIKATISKELTGETKKTPQDYDVAIKQIVSNAVSSGEVIDIFSAAGIQKPDVAILSDEFLEDIKNLKYQSVAVEILQKLLDGKIKSISRKNVLRGESFVKLLEDAIRKYQNKTIEAAEVILELIKLAKEVREEAERGNEMGLSEDEVAFYDALANNESAVLELGDEVLRRISKELVEMLRKSTTIDWNIRASVRAKIRLSIKKLLKKYKYPPDSQNDATQLVLSQAEMTCADWTGIAS